MCAALARVRAARRETGLGLNAAGLEACAVALAMLPAHRVHHHSILSNWGVLCVVFGNFGCSVGCCDLCGLQKVQKAGAQSLEHALHGSRGVSWARVSQSQWRAWLQCNDTKIATKLCDNFFLRPTGFWLFLCAMRIGCFPPPPTAFCVVRSRC